MPFLRVFFRNKVLSYVYDRLTLRNIYSAAIHFTALMTSQVESKQQKTKILMTAKWPLVLRNGVLQKNKLSRCFCYDTIDTVLTWRLLCRWLWNSNGKFCNVNDRGNRRTLVTTASASSVSTAVTMCRLQIALWETVTTWRIGSICST